MRVWYAAYGSNLSRERFLCYLRGGRPLGAARVYRGCMDRRAPAADLPATLPHRLYFAGESSVWGGATAFLAHDPGDGPATLARLWLVTREQFAELVAQENHLPALRLPARHSASPRLYVCGQGRYGAVLHCGQRDGRPILTVTSPVPAGSRRPAAPRPVYLQAIAAGLRETHRLPPAAAADYLLSRVGARGALVTREALMTLPSEPRRPHQPPASATSPRRTRR